MRDANGQQFWQLSQESDWRLLDAATEYDGECRHLRLRDRRPPRKATAPDLARAEVLRRLPSRVRDAFGTLAWWEGSTILTNGALRKATPPGTPIELWRPVAGSDVRDLALGNDDVLYVAIREPLTGGGTEDVVRLVDRRDRWRSPVAAKLPGFTPEKLAADPAGGVLAMDCTRQRLARVRGMPLRDFQREAVQQFAPTVFRPRPEDPDPLRMDFITGPLWLAVENLIAASFSTEGRLAVLTWRGVDESWVYLREADGTWLSPRQVAGNDRLISLAWLSATELAGIPAPKLSSPNARMPEAVVFSPDDPTAVFEPSGSFYPLRNLGEGPWIQKVGEPLHYPVGAADSAPLVPLSVVTYERTGQARGRVLDSGAEHPTWHRLNVEALIPPSCGFIIEVGCTDDPEELPPDDEWHGHHFGKTPTQSSTSPRGVLLRGAGDLPLHAGFLGDDAADEARGTVAGTFTVLIQRDGRRVRAVRGRAFHIRVRLFGGGHSTPKIYAVRAWCSRYSYRDQHLAELYREAVFGEEANAKDAATPADFLERFLGLFESVLTPMEDHVAAAYRLTSPNAVPEASLDWLGSWIGEISDAGLPVERRRAWLEASSWLHRAHGTLAGLQLALEIVTGGRMMRQFGEEAGKEIVFPFGGSVTGGEILILEEFRLQRTMATILGANLSVANDPLLPGLISSANSLVGDTLILGDSEKKEFLALFQHAFSADSTTRDSEVAAVEGLFNRVAHRVTVLVHQEVESQDLGLIRRVAERMAPAHVLVTVLPASAPLLIGLSSLVEVDTYLVPRPPRAFAQVNVSQLGGNTFVQRLPSLDPRLGGGRRDFAKPAARISAPEEIVGGSELLLDASASTAGTGRELSEFAWTWIPGSSETPPSS
jgi:phage tail-like protein